MLSKRRSGDGAGPPPARFVRRRAAGYGHAIASRDELIDRAKERSRRTGESLDHSSAAVVEDLETAAAALNARVAPLVPGCGVLVAIAGIVLKATPSSDGIPEAIAGVAVLFSLLGFSFTATALFMHAGRRTVGLAPTLQDIPFAHDRLVRKYRRARRGGFLAAIGLACLVVGIISGVDISVRVH